MRPATYMKWLCEIEFLIGRPLRADDLNYLATAYADEPHWPPEEAAAVILRNQFICPS